MGSKIKEFGPYYYNMDMIEYIRHPIKATILYLKLVTLSRYIHLDSIDSYDKGVSTFIIGWSGIGKTYIINKYFRELEDVGRVVIIDRETNYVLINNRLYSEVVERYKEHGWNDIPKTIIFNDFGSIVGAKKQSTIQNILTLLRDLTEEGINKFIYFKKSNQMLVYWLPEKIRMNVIGLMTPSDLVRMLNISYKSGFGIGTILSRFLIFYINADDRFIENYKLVLSGIEKNKELDPNIDIDFELPKDIIKVNPIEDLSKEALSRISNLRDVIYQDNFTKLSLDLTDEDKLRHRYYSYLLKLLYSIAYIKDKEVPDDKDLEELEYLATKYLMISQTPYWHIVLSKINKYR